MRWSCVLTYQRFRFVMLMQRSFSCSEAANGQLLLFQLPDVLPGLPPSDDDDRQQGAQHSTKGTSERSPSEQKVQLERFLLSSMSVLIYNCNDDIVCSEWTSFPFQVPFLFSYLLLQPLASKLLYTYFAWLPCSWCIKLDQETLSFKNRSNLCNHFTGWHLFQQRLLASIGIWIHLYIVAFPNTVILLFSGWGIFSICTHAQTSKELLHNFLLHVDDNRKNSITESSVNQRWAESYFLDSDSAPLSGLKTPAPVSGLKTPAPTYFKPSTPTPVNTPKTSN